MFLAVIGLFRATVFVIMFLAVIDFFSPVFVIFLTDTRAVDPEHNHSSILTLSVTKWQVPTALDKHRMIPQLIYPPKVRWQGVSSKRLLTITVVSLMILD